MNMKQEHSQAAAVQHEKLSSRPRNNCPAPRMLTNDDLPIGAMVRQGDIYLTRIERITALPAGPVPAT